MALVAGPDASPHRILTQGSAWRFVDYWAMTHDADLDRYHVTKA
jgi:hypothetical protein